MHQPEDSPRIQRNALVAGIAAFVAWGLAPAYLEAAQNRALARNPRAPLHLDRALSRNAA